MPRTYLATIAAIGLAVSAWGLCAVRAQAPQEKKEEGQSTSYWMKKKLEYSQHILEGLAEADYDKIVENAQAMRRLNRIEGFIRGQMPGYRGHLNVFETALDEIIRQGNKDNVDGAALAFTQLTVSCVNCHKYLRENK